MKMSSILIVFVWTSNQTFIVDFSLESDLEFYLCKGKAFSFCKEYFYLEKNFEGPPRPGGNGGHGHVKSRPVYIFEFNIKI